MSSMKTILCAAFQDTCVFSTWMIQGHVQHGRFLGPHSPPERSKSSPAREASIVISYTWGGLANTAPGFVDLFEDDHSGPFCQTVFAVQRKKHEIIDWSCTFLGCGNLMFVSQHVHHFLQSLVLQQQRTQRASLYG